MDLSTNGAATGAARTQHSPSGRGLQSKRSATPTAARALFAIGGVRNDVSFAASSISAEQRHQGGLRSRSGFLKNAPEMRFRRIATDAHRLRRIGQAVGGRQMT